MNKAVIIVSHIHTNSTLLINTHTKIFGDTNASRRREVKLLANKTAGLSSLTYQPSHVRHLHSIGQ